MAAADSRFFCLRCGVPHFQDAEGRSVAEFLAARRRWRLGTWYIMTIKEATERVGKSESALRRAVKAGKLDAKLVKGKYNITEEALNAYADPVERVGAPRRDEGEAERLETITNRGQTSRFFFFPSIRNTSQNIPSVT